jgi:hypothetical protein
MEKLSRNFRDLKVCSLIITPASYKYPPSSPSTLALLWTSSEQLLCLSTIGMGKTSSRCRSSRPEVQAGEKGEKENYDK